MQTDEDRARVKRLVIGIGKRVCSELGVRYPDALCDNLEGDVVRFRALRALRVELPHLTPLARDELVREYLTP